MCLDHEALPHPAPLVKGHAAWGWARGAGSMAPGKTKTASCAATPFLPPNAGRGSHGTGKMLGLSAGRVEVEPFRPQTLVTGVAIKYTRDVP